MRAAMRTPDSGYRYKLRILEDVTTHIGSLGCFFPAYNEEENIGPLIDEALATLGRFADSFEIVVVDDGSKDGTAEVVRSYAERHPQVRLVSHPTNLGYGHAIRSGLDHTRGDVVAWVDGDRQYRIADLALLLDHLDGADVVVGHRTDRADVRRRLVIARIYHAVLQRVFGLRLHDVDIGFKLFRREVVDAIAPQLVARSATISPEFLIRAQRAGFRIAEVPVPHHPRLAGRSKGATPRVVLRTIGEIVALRRSLGGSGE